jgi:hypothetical protein
MEDADEELLDFGSKSGDRWSEICCRRRNAQILRHEVTSLFYKVVTKASERLRPVVEV